MVAATRKKAVASAKNETSAEAKTPLYLIHGDDDFLVAEEARKIIAELIPKDALEFGLETIEGSAANQGEAAQIFCRLFEALQSHSFFASEKVVWWRDTNLLGASPTASGAAVAESLISLNELLKDGIPQGVSLVITATELDGRKGVVKTLQKTGKVVSFKNDPYKPQENESQALQFAHEITGKLGRKLSHGAARLIVEMAGNDCRTIRSELEKVASYAGDRQMLEESDVQAIGSWRPGGVVWDLPDAIGERNLAKALDVLQNLIFLGESPVALIFAIIARVRLLLLLRTLTEKKLLRSCSDYHSFKSEFDRLPEWVLKNMPTDKKLNPLAGHPFVLWKAMPGVRHFTAKELTEALEALLDCNERMVSTGIDGGKALEEMIVKICMSP